MWQTPRACLCRYCFSLYSSQLKEHFGYSQEEIQGIGSANNLGDLYRPVRNSCPRASLPWGAQGPSGTFCLMF